MSTENNPNEPPMFVRMNINATWFDVAIADISAIEAPVSPGQPIQIIVGGLRGVMNAESYPTVHAAWIARRRALGR